MSTIPSAESISFVRFLTNVNWLMSLKAFQSLVQDMRHTETDHSWNEYPFQFMCGFFQCSCSNFSSSSFYHFSATSIFRNRSLFCGHIISLFAELLKEDRKKKRKSVHFNILFISFLLFLSFISPSFIHFPFEKQSQMNIEIVYLEIQLIQVCMELSLFFIIYL